MPVTPSSFPISFSLPCILSNVNLLHKTLPGDTWRFSLRRMPQRNHLRGASGSIQPVNRMVHTTPPPPHRSISNKAKHQHPPVALPPTHGGPVHSNPSGFTTFPQRYPGAAVPLLNLTSISYKPTSVHGATALHWKLATFLLFVVPLAPRTSRLRIWNCEFVQLPVPGAPEKRVHWETVKAPPRMPSISRLLACTSDATGGLGDGE